MDPSYPALVTCIAILEYMAFGMRAGFSREKYGVHAPAVTGNEVWERMFRVQQNTLEQLIVFLPALWMFSYFVSPTIGAGVGLLFLIGRPIYAITYVQDPKKRTVGFLLGMLSNTVLLLGSLIAAIGQLLSS